MRILLVEDHELLRSLLARVLRGHGFEVCEAADGRAALECLEQSLPDLVLTGLQMPGLDGLGLLRRLRSLPGMESVPVVVMSAGATPEAEHEVRRAGAAEFLAKPVDAPMLLACVGGYCQPRSRSRGRSAPPVRTPRTAPRLPAVARGLLY